ncbi:MAG: DUF401 family protein [Acidobacteriota bacterium]
MILIKLAIIILILLTLIRLKIDLGITMCTGSILAGIFFRMKPLSFVNSVIEAATEKSTLDLVGIVLLVIILGNLMSKKGSFDQLVKSLTYLIPYERVVLFLPSSLIGLLPMPGGALFSAPMLEATSKKFNLSPEYKTLINFWFRHIWEYVWPLYPGLIMTASMWQIPVKKIIYSWFPMTVASFLAGLIFVFVKLPKFKKDEKNNNFLKSLLILLSSLWEILIIIFLTFALNIPLILSIFISVILTLITTKISFKEKMKITIKSISLKTAFLLVSVMVFKNVLEDSRIFSEITSSLNIQGYFSYFFLFFAPFIIGLLTGANQAYVGISFPILMPVIGFPSPKLYTLLFAYVSGFMGTYISPSHFCLSLSSEYFKADFKKVVKLMIPLISILILFSLSLSILLPNW